MFLLSLNYGSQSSRQSFSIIFTRPGVARAVLHTALSLFFLIIDRPGEAGAVLQTAS